jgi:nitrogen fixation protein FixH
MNWGTAIVLFFIFFAVSMVSAVVATTKHPPQLVQKDYYALDLNYQAHLEKKQHAAALSVRPEVVFDVAARAVQVTFPQGMTARTGTVKCYRSANAGDDITTALKDQATATIPIGHVPGGRWHVALDWEDTDGKAYFLEKILELHPPEGNN